jgi:hypothetical protein
MFLEPPKAEAPASRNVLPAREMTIHELLLEVQTRVQSSLHLSRKGADIINNRALLEDARVATSTLLAIIESLEMANVKMCQHPDKVTRPATGYDPRDQTSYGGGWSCGDCGGEGV